MAVSDSPELFLKKRLKTLRLAHGLTQEQVAELSEISAIYYQSIEAGRRPNVSLRVMARLASAYGLQLHELFSPEISRPAPLKRTRAPRTLS